MRTIIIISVAAVSMSMSAVRAANRPFIFGMNPIGGAEAGRDPKIHDPAMYKAIAAAGGTIVRIGFNWDQIEREKGKPNWENLDRDVNFAVDNNLAIVGLINSTPSWASPTGKDTPFYAPKDESMGDFESFCRQLVARYKGRIKFWEIWNEANGWGWHTDKGYNQTEEYMPVLKASYKTLKAADPTCLVGATGLDDAGGNAEIFLRKIYELGGKGYFDAVIDHPYYEGQYRMDKLLKLRKIMDDNGDKALPIWITENGWNTDGDPEKAKQIGVYLKDYLDQIDRPDYDWIPIATYHTICDFSMKYGLMDKNLNPRPAYEVFKSYLKPARPVASDVKIEAIGKGTVRVTCKTNTPATARVLYGTTRNYGEMTGSTALGTKHTVKILGLKSGTLYQFRIRPATGTYNFSFSSNHEVKVK